VRIAKAASDAGASVKLADQEAVKTGVHVAQVLLDLTALFNQALECAEAALTKEQLAAVQWALGAETKALGTAPVG
jgi:hypothetical protein